MVAQLATVKENLRRLIQQRKRHCRGGRAPLWLNRFARPSRRCAMKRRTRRGHSRLRRSPPPKRAPRHGRRSADELRRPRRRNRVRWTLFALLPIALVVGGYLYVTGGQVMSTDDAYVQAEKVGISTDVSGIVQDVDG